MSPIKEIRVATPEESASIDWKPNSNNGQQREGDQCFEKVLEIIQASGIAVVEFWGTQPFYESVHQSYILRYWANKKGIKLRTRIKDDRRANSSTLYITINNTVEV